ncbi:MAG: LacI family transcriptional regulator [Firmicutes bacterium]|jgi:LacI family transcriptional regulator|nr:LacI family transcriptional regulator [Bacillota bacterium]
MANIKDVAKKAGVSVATVSRVLNHPETVSEKTSKKIHDIMEKMNYKPNAAARSLALNKSYTVALMVPNILNPLFPHVAKGVEEVVLSKGYNMILFNTENSAKKEAEFLETLVDRRVDGVILANTKLDEKYLKKVIKKKLPIVLLGSDFNSLDMNIVYTDYSMGAYMITKHLLEVGYQKIFFVSSPFSWKQSDMKREGYLRALKENGVMAEENWIFEGNNDIESGYKCVKKIIQEGNKLPDAIFFANDLMAYGAIEALKDSDIKIPEDIGIAGFDDIFTSSIIDPKLTTVSLPVMKMGSIGARLLIEMLEEKDGLENQKVFLKPRIKIRRSCINRNRINEIFFD